MITTRKVKPAFKLARGTDNEAVVSNEYHLAVKNSPNAPNRTPTTQSMSIDWAPETEGFLQRLVWSRYVEDKLETTGARWVRTMKPLDNHALSIW